MQEFVVRLEMSGNRRTGAIVRGGAVRQEADVGGEKDENRECPWDNSIVNTAVSCIYTSVKEQQLTEVPWPLTLFAPERSQFQ